MMREEIKRRIHDVENELKALKELVDSDAFAPKEPELTGFEQGIRDMIVNALTTTHTVSDGQVTSSVAMDYNTTHLLAAGILELAKKEICKGCTVSIDSYIKGRDDEREAQDKSKTSHYDTYQPPCFHGGVCTNPMRDCINCPMHSSGTTTNTTSGTCKKED